MGNSVTKLDEKQRLKIYKRVSLLEARDQYSKIAAELLKQNMGSIHIRFFGPFAKPPISMNFYVTGVHRGILAPSKDELSGTGVHAKGHFRNVFNYLASNMGVGTVLSEYYLGLDQEQHDMLWLDTPAMAAAKIIAEVKKINNR